MASQKIWTAAQKWLQRWAKPVEQLTPDQITHRVKSAYVDGYERGRRDQRNHGSRRNNRPTPLGAEEL